MIENGTLRAELEAARPLIEAATRAFPVAIKRDLERDQRPDFSLCEMSEAILREALALRENHERKK